jgi:hypothetical protein
MIRAADHRMTWVCTGEPPTARLQLAGPSRGILDGVWWPASRDPVVELCSLVTALTAQRGGVIERIMLQPRAWDRHPRRIGVGAVVVRVGWFRTLDAALVILTGRQDLRIDLTIVPPETPYAVAKATMLAASHPDNTTPAADTLTPSSLRSGRLVAHVAAEAVSEPEVGQIQSDEHPTAPART